MEREETLRRVSEIKKVIVVGLDGLEPSIVERLLGDGQLPNFARLLPSDNALPRVGTTTPAQTPVAWSTFATGMNPGGHGIFDFLRRDAQRYLPDLGLVRYQQKSAVTPPAPVNLRRGKTIWERLSDEQIPASVIRCPCTFPPDKFRGRQLSGMGVPDLRGGLGTGTFYTTNREATAGESERLVHIDVVPGRPTRVSLSGPRKSAKEDTGVELTLHVGADGKQVRVQTSGRPSELTLELGTWSPWVRLKFKLGMLQSVRGMVRLLLVRTEPNFELYVTPVNFDPHLPWFPISRPDDWAGELADELGMYYTTGMVEDDGGLKNGRFDEAAFLAQCENVWNERQKMLLRELERRDEGFVYCLFDTPDRIQHMFWRFLEPDHPSNVANGFDESMGGVIDDAYRRCDRILGEVQEYVDDRTLLIAMSDHGFGSFQRGVELNAWLHQQGLLVLKDGTQPGEGTSELFRGVDWSKTQAYAAGLGGIYLNVAGREARGIVAPDEADALADRIAQQLTGMEDPVRQCVGVRGAATRREAYQGPYAEESPDVVVRFARGYRVAWQTAIGGTSANVFEDNTNKWSGDHIVDPAEVPGMLLVNRAFDASDPQMVDLAPTILTALGAKPDESLEGRNLLV